MKSPFLLLIAMCLLLAGCGEYGGGSVLEPTVTILPADLSGESSDSNSAGEVTNSATDSASSGPGTFSGRVVFNGTAEARPPIFAKGAAIKDAEVCAAEDLPDESLIVGADNGVKNVFVFMRKAPKGTPKPSGDVEVIFDQKGCRFIPHCLIVPVGATVKVLSDDDAAHNTHTNPARNTGLTQLVAANDREGSLKFKYTSAENPFPVTCDFHAWMKAYHLPLDHPFGAITDDSGKFEIKGIPSGEHDFVVWHEDKAGNFIERKLKVEIKAGETTTKEIKYN